MMAGQEWSSQRSDWVSGSRKSYDTTSCYFLQGTFYRFTAFHPSSHGTSSSVLGALSSGGRQMDGTKQPRQAGVLGEGQGRAPDGLSSVVAGESWPPGKEEHRCVPTGTGG